MKKILLSLLLGCFVLNISAANYFVNAAKTDDSGDGLSWGNAKKSITAAVTASGNTAANIYVAAGTYTENLGSPNTASINYEGGYPTDNIGTNISNRNISSNITIIDGSSLRKGVTIARANYVVSGFTIQNCVSGANSLGGAVSLINNSTIRNCIIKNSVITTSNAKWAGAGVYMTGGTVEDCEIFGNSTQALGSGAGVYIAGGTLQRCKVYNNTAGTLGGGVLVGNKNSTAIDKELVNNVVVANCLIYNNSKQGLYVSSIATNVKTVQIVNNTVVNNALPIVISDVATPTAMVSGANNIFYNNTSDETFTIGTAFTYNAIQVASVTGTGNIALASGNQSTYFTSPTAATGIIADASSDWSLLSASNCKNVGTSSVSAIYGATDAVGNTRVVNTTVDLGALEAQTTPTITISTSSLTGFAYNSGSGPTAEQSFTVSGENLTEDISIAPPTNYEISTGTGGSFVATNPITLTISGGAVATTTIYVRLKAGLNVANYNAENVACTSAGATTQNVACSGTVSAVLTTQATSSVTNTTATGNGTITIDGGTNTSERGFCWDLAANPDPDTSDSKVTDAASYSTGAFTGSVTGLTQLTSYKIRAYAIHNGVTSYGDVQTFTTEGPIITVSTTTLTGFTYPTGEGPSAEQSFTISGTYLTDDIVLTAPTNYEISKGTGVGFSHESPLTLAEASGDVASTTIYVRLKAGLALNDYNAENIVSTSTNATTRNVTCSGLVTPSLQIYGATGIADGTVYSSLKAAFDAINANTTQTGNNITVRINSSTTETASAVLNAGNWTTLKVYPTATGLSVTGSIANAPLIDLNGADNVTIDGDVGADSNDKDLTVSNTSTSNLATTSTIRFIADATSNTVKNCTLKGATTNTTAGIIFFSSASSGGNDNNTITNNNITNATGRPVSVISSAGTTANENSGNTISNNNIYDFFSQSLNSYGINLRDNTTAWTISGNSFYETASYSPSATTTLRVINIENTTGVGFIISGNYIGGNAASCGGTAWTKTTQGTTFSAIYVSAGYSLATEIQGNTIKNLSWSNSGNPSWTGINIQGSTVANIGSTTGNVIGASDGTITVTNTSSGNNFYGINLNSTGAVLVKSNTISYITITTGATSAYNFTGIYKSARTGTPTITYNTINNINASSASTGNAQLVYGIRSLCSAHSVITNNTITNMTNGTTNASTSTAGLIEGIYAGDSYSTVTSVTVSNNTIDGLSIANASTSRFDEASAVGVAVMAKYGYVFGNTIKNISNTYSSFAGNVIGLFIRVGKDATTQVFNNFISDLSNSVSTASTDTIFGIRTRGGLSIYSNNVVNITTNTPSCLIGLHEIGGGQYHKNYMYYNTIYIGGTPTSGAMNSFAIYSGYTSDKESFIKNCLLVNARSNSGSATGKHYGAYLTNTSTIGLYLANNDYYTPGTGGVLGYYNNSDVTSLTGGALVATVDANSLNVDPLLTISSPTVSADYKTAVTMTAITGTGVSSDFEGAARNATSPQIGAFEIPLVDGSALINMSPTLFSFNYQYSKGPSDEGNFTISGSNLIADITLTPPSNFEISISSGAGFQSTPITLTQSAGSVAATTIYTRMKASLASNSYNQNISASSTNAVTKVVTCLGVVTPAQLNISGVSGVNKTYTGTTAASLSGTPVYVGLVAPDAFAVTGSPIATFASANVGGAIPIDISVTGYTAPSTNYEVVQPADLSANITAAALTITGMSVVTRVYDGTTAATLTGTAAYSGLKNGEVFGVTGTPSAVFDNATVGAGKTVTVTGYTVPTSNYSITQPTLTGQIISDVLTVSGTANLSDYPVLNAYSGVISVVVSDAAVLTVDATWTIKDLTVEAGGKLLTSANVLTVEDVYLKANKTKSFSAKLDEGIALSGTAHYLKTIDDTQWFMLSLPCDVAVNDIAQSDGSPLGTLGSGGDWFVKYYDGALRATGTYAGTWKHKVAGETLTAGKGYILGLKTGVGPYEIDFPLNASLVNTAETERSVAVTAYGDGTAVYEFHKGWNLIGQPYLSKYTATGVTGTNYLVVSDGGVTGTYTGYEATSVPTMDPFYAFFVQANLAMQTSGISFALASRQSMRSAVDAETAQKVKLTLSTPSGEDNTGLIIDDIQSTAYEIGEDLEKWLSTSSTKAQLYTNLGGVNYAFNALPGASVNDLPLGLYSKTAASASIRADKSRAPGLTQLLLTDKKLGIVTDLMQSDYTFTADAGNTTARFALRVPSVTTKLMDVSQNENYSIFTAGKNLIIKNLPLNATIAIYDGVGRLVSSRISSADVEEVPLAIAGMYTVRISTEMGISTQKVFIR